jgi:hypothetical protein
LAKTLILVAVMICFVAACGQEPTTPAANNGRFSVIDFGIDSARAAGVIGEPDDTYVMHMAAADLAALWDRQAITSELYMAGPDLGSALVLRGEHPGVNALQRFYDPEAQAWIVDLRGGISFTTPPMPGVDQPMGFTADNFQVIFFDDDILFAHRALADSSTVPPLGALVTLDQKYDDEYMAAHVVSPLATPTSTVTVP